MFPAYEHLSAYDRHKKLINDYFLVRGGSALNLQRNTSHDKTDHDVIRENHKFLWNDDEDDADSWGARLARKYYDKLFKEYCLCDLTYYKYNKVALRWRTEKEVIVGKGQFECSNKKCTEKEGLRSWEMNFGYVEHGEKKNALVKLRLCVECSKKLNFSSQKREAKRRKSKRNTSPSSKSEVESSTSQVMDVTEIENETAEEDSVTQVKTEVDETEAWKQKPTENVEKSREKEFEEYLADLLM